MRAHKNFPEDYNVLIFQKVLDICLSDVRRSKTHHQEHGNMLNPAFMILAY